ncbi:MAG: hypothetical protein IJR85_07130 [Synergistaceae bacterium]|nr:hypothetical protein [Synergistaceae bacterium]
MLNRKLSASILAVLLCVPALSFAAEKIDPVLAQWSHETEVRDKDGDQTVKVKATYYSNEYVEALVASEAEKNLWTADEMENYKYTLLKNLNLGESIPFHIDINVRGVPMYAGPFDKHITMMVGKNKYSPIDYDKRFNFKIQGSRDGMVFFPRYDPKTGKEILDGAKDVRVIFDSAISMAMATRGDVTWVWDLTKDRAKIGGGKAANRLEVDRLLKRNEKLNADREALRKQLEALDKEAGEINTRIDELQSE